MTIAYNSPYVQTETLNFTFASKPLLCILMPNGITVGLLADGHHDIIAARRAAESPF